MLLLTSWSPNCYKKDMFLNIKNQRITSDIYYIFKMHRHEYSYIKKKFIYYKIILYIVISIDVPKKFNVMKYRNKFKMTNNTQRKPLNMKLFIIVH